MYTNKCIKCGKEFETKNPKRVICPDCLYSTEGAPAAPNPSDDGTQDFSRGYSAGSENPERYQQRRPNYNNNYNNQRQGGYNNYGNQGGGYNRPNNNFRRPNNNRPNNNFRRNNQRPGGGRNFNQRRPQRPQKSKPLLVNKEQLAAIEEMYKKMLPLPNPDAHEVIAAAIELEPKKVFFGINLIRQKMMLPKIQFPKRKLAITPDQMMAIKNLYEPLLPLPPIGCHKILAAQLKMDEWRVHVGIGLVRKQMGLDRWNEDRDDVPEELRKKQGTSNSAKKEEEKPAKAAKSKKAKAEEK